MNRKNLFMSALITIVLLAVVFIPLSDQQNGTYDPWIDTNDDGIIDIYDLEALGSLYGTSGSPINKTALLLDLQSRVEALEAYLDALPSTVSYIMGKVGGYYYVVNGTNSRLWNYSTLFSVVEQKVLDVGGTIWHKAGSYIVDAQLNVAVANTELLGDSGATWTFDTSLTSDLTMLSVTADNFKVSNMRFNGIRSQISGTQTAIRLDNVSFAQVKDCFFESFSGDGIFAANTIMHSKVLANTFYDIYDDAVDMNNARHSSINDNTFKHIGDNGIDTEGAMSLTINDNTFRDISFWATGNAIELEQEGTTPTHTSDCTVSGNTIDTVYRGIHINSGKDNSITGNTFKNVTYGIWLQTAGGSRHSTNNTITGNTFKTVAIAPIAERDSNQDFQLIQNNIFINTPAPIIKGANTVIRDNIGYPNVYSDASYNIFKEGSYYYLQDGSTGTTKWRSTSAHAIFKAAIGNLTNGGIIFAGKANYTFGWKEQILITNPNIQLRGEGKKTVFCKTSGGANTIELRGKAATPLCGIVLSNFAVETQVYTDSDAVTLRYVDNSTIEKLWITSRYAPGQGFEEGIVLYNSRFNTIQNNWIIGCAQANIELALNGTVGNFVTRNFLFNGRGDGIYVWGASNNTISHNFITDSTDDGIELYADIATGGDGNIYDTKILYNIITSSGDRGIIVTDSGGYYAKNTEIVGNTITYSDSVQIQIGENPCGTKIRQNTISFGGSFGILSSSDHPTWIEGNDIFNHTAAGAAGIKVWGGLFHTISRNTVQYSTLRGIHLENSNYSSVSDNLIMYNTNGVDFSGTDCSQITLNRVFNNSNIGIFLSSATCERNIVTSNIALDNGTNILDLGSGTVLDNNVTS